MTKQEKQNAIRFFLKEGFSTRKIDSILGYDSKETKGWKSWNILKQNNINEKHRHAFFLYSEIELKKIIEFILTSTNQDKVNELLKNSPPKILSKYENSYLTCKSELELTNIISGEARNITQQFFKKDKKTVGTCQLNGCNNTNLDTVHLNDRRPNLLRQAASKSIIGEINNLKIFDIQSTFKIYLGFHSKPKTICYLCKKHHNELEKLETKGPKSMYKSFVKNIIIP